MSDPVKEVKATGNVLINRRTGEKEWFSQNLLVQALKSGEWEGQEGDRMLLIDRSGAPRAIDAGDALRAVSLGGGRYQAETTEHIRHREEESYLEAKYGDAPVQTFFESVGRGVSFGLYDPIAKALGASTEGLRERKARHSGWITGTGEIGGLVGSALLTGGGSLLVKGGTAGAKAAVGTGAGAAAKAAIPAAAGRTATQAIAGMTPAGLAFRGSQAVGRASVPLGAKIAGVEAAELATATGFKAGLGRMVPYAVEGAAEGAAYGAGHAISMATLNEDPLTAEAFWSEVGSGALWGGAFGGGLSAVLDTGKYLKSVKDKAFAARQEFADASSEAIYSTTLEKKDLLIKKMEDKAALKAAKVEERQAAKGLTDTEKAHARKLKEQDKEIARLEVRLDRVRDGGVKEQRKLAVALQRAEDAVVSKQKALNTIEDRIGAGESGLSVKVAKLELKNARDAEKAAKSAHEKSAQKLSIEEGAVKAELDSVMTAPLTEGGSKLSDTMTMLRNNARAWRGEGFLITRRFGLDDIPAEFSGSGEKLQRALKEYEEALFHTKRGKDYTATGWKGGKIEKSGPIKDSRVVLDDESAALFASAEPAVFKNWQRLTKNLEEATEAHAANVRNFFDDISAQVAPNKPVTSPNTPRGIFEKQYSPSQYLDNIWGHSKAADTGKGSLMDTAGEMEVLGTAAGFGTTGDYAEDLGVPGANLLQTYLHYKGGRALLKNYKGVTKPPPSVAAAKGALTSARKRAAEEQIERQINRLRMQGASKDHLELALDVARKKLDDAKLAYADNPELNRKAIEEAEAVLDSTRTARDLGAGNRDEILEAQKYLEDMKEATSLAEAQSIASTADARFGRTAGKDKGKGRGMVHQALTNGVSSSTWLKTREKLGRGMGGTFLASLLSGGVRKIAGKMTLDGAIPRAYNTTREKITGAVGSFIGLPGKYIDKPLKFAATKTVLDNITFGPEEFKGEKIARMSPLQFSYYKKVKEIRSLVANPENLMDRLMVATTNLRAVNPQLANQVVNNEFKRIMFIASKIPQTPPVGYAGSRYDEHIPSNAAISKFARYARAAWEPMSVMDKLAKGKLTKEESEALRTTSPEMFMRIQEQFIERLPDRKKPLPFAKRVQLSILFNMPADSVMSAIQSRQQVFAVQPQPAQPKVDLSRVRNSISNQETDTQRRSR